MDKHKLHFEDLGVSVEMSSFVPEGGVAEHHAILHVEPRGNLFDRQLQRIYEAEERVMSLPQFAGAVVVMKRYFLSDATNQAPLMRHEADCSISLIQQPPMDGSKVCVWMYIQQGTTVQSDADDVIVVSHNGYRHLWKMGMQEPEGNSEQQCTTLLERYEDILSRYGATLADNCIRTWFFVRDVDTQYAGMVKGRKQNFIEQGLTEKTHYISSTGIGGVPADTRALMQLGTYAMTGFAPEQQRYLYAPDYLNPTYEYGVTFERGTLMEYGDRGHLYISGTASINNKGEVMHVGDIRNQTRRMWENVEALLNEGGAGLDDIMQIVVYLRDCADYKVVSEMFKEKFPDTPYVITLAPVCRPSWLIEMECIAVNGRDNSQYRDF